MVSLEVLTVGLDSINITHRDKIGGKALNLGDLIKNNFNIPKGFILTTDAYTYFIERNNLDIKITDLLERLNFSDSKNVEEISKKIQIIFEKGEIPKDLVDEIKDDFNTISGENFVVRSSAIGEDSEKASFAGQYESYLNLKTLKEILHHIKKCYASLWSNRALNYRKKNGIPHNDTKIAVIVQEMVPAKSAGVLFTFNPITSEKSEILIESNFGLGESVMAGICSPDQFIIKKNSQKKQKKFEIIGKKIGKKEYVVNPNKRDEACGIETIKLSEEAALKASLSDEEILTLSKLGMEIEALFKKPQDIEWAIDEKKRISILQSRPITSFREVRASKDIIYSRGYSDDYWNDNVTPLFFDLLGDQLTDIVNVELNSIMGYKKMETQLLKLYNGHVYFNLEVLKRKVENEIPSIMRNEDILNYFPNGRGEYGKETIEDLPFHTINRIVGELRIMIHDPNGSITKTDKAYYEWTREKFNPYYTEFNKKLEKLRIKKNLNELFTLAEELDILMRDHFRLVRYGIPVHNIGMNLLVQYLLTRFLGKQECYKFYPILISGLDHKLTETNQEIHNLAAFIQQNPQLKKIITKTDPKDLYKELRSYDNVEIKQFIDIFDKFLDEYGDRGFTREPYYPRWREAPEYVFEILKSLIMEHEKNLENIQSKNEKYRKLVEKYSYSRFRSQFLGFLKWKIFSIILNLSKRYIKFREEQRFNLDKWITLNRELFLVVGNIFKEKDFINNQDDIFFLRRKEIDYMINRNPNDTNIEDLKSKIDERRKIFTDYEDKIPPKFISGKREYNDCLEYEEDSSFFKGNPASQGEITAPIRVLATINDISKVKPGEILVVPRTDPGWTPIFSKIGGLITETGGVLSHGAVVSREYGIPAVTNISNACKYFKTGQIVSLNGYNGIVRVK